MNPVTILPRVRVTAWQGDPSDNPRLYPTQDIREALEARYHTDAMILAYGGPNADAYPRLGVASAAYYELFPGEAPALTVAMFDVDVPGHADSTPEWVASQVALLTPEQRKVWAWYRTPHGLRLVARLSEPVPLLRANALLEVLFEELDARGVEMDPACRRWYRLYRAPRAKGLDLEMDLAPLDRELDVSAYGPLEAMEAKHFGPVAVSDRPTTPPSGPPSLADAKRALGSGSRLGDDLAKDRFAAPEGRRHETLLRAAGDIVSASGTDNPRTAYDLLAWAAVKMGKDLEELWRLCTWATARGVGAREAQLEEKREAAQRIAATIGAKNPEDVERRVIIDAGKSFFVLDEFTGVYNGPISHDHQIPGALRDHAPNLAGEYAHPAATKTETIFYLGSPARRVIYTYDPSEAGYDPVHKTFTMASVNVCDDVYPEYSADIDAWLRLMDTDGHLLDWLAAYPRFERPVCALYLDGSPGIGKGMLAAGLARVYSVHSEFTPYASLLKEFNATLRNAPLIWADENVPTDSFGDSGSSLFRRLVGSSTHSIRELYEVRATLQGCPRILITANNPGALTFGREEIQRDDLLALQERVGYLDAKTDAPKEYLETLSKAKGYPSQRAMTEGEGWVEGGGIARHVLWLAENRPLVHGRRFLVEGWKSELFDAMLSSVGSTEVIALAIITAILSPISRVSSIPSVRFFGGEVFVHLQELTANWPELTGFDKNKAPTFGAVKAAVKRLAVSDTESKPKRLAPVGRDTGALRYWRLDAKRIGKIAATLGICDVEDIVDIVAREAEPDYNPNWADEVQPPSAITALLSRVPEV